MSTEAAPLTRAQQGEATRNRIIKTAMEFASRQGLEAISIGQLAKELELSKSGLFAHFGSKEELQISTIEAAEVIFSREIVYPAKECSSGLAKLQMYLEKYMEYLNERVSQGGCFFTAVAAEYDDRPGRVRDRIALSMRKWRALLEDEALVAHATPKGLATLQ